RRTARQSTSPSSNDGTGPVVSLILCRNLSPQERQTRCKQDLRRSLGCVDAFAVTRARYCSSCWNCPDHRYRLNPECGRSFHEPDLADFVCLLFPKFFLGIAGSRAPAVLVQRQGLDRQGTACAKSRLNFVRLLTGGQPVLNEIEGMLRKA